MPRLLPYRALLVFALASPAIAQVHGIPASAVSNAPRHSFGIPASVTSLGPDGFADSRVDFSGSDTRFSSREPVRHSRLPGQHFRPRLNYPITYGYPVYLYPDSYYDREVESAPAYEPARQEPQKIIVEIRDTREQKSAAIEQPIAKKEEPKAAPERPSDPVIIVMLDGRKEALSDYAIMGSYIFDLSNGTTRKIPIDTIDVPATRKINEQRGVEFKLPQTLASR
jgi:hypothetical protein